MSREAIAGLVISSWASSCCSGSAAIAYLSLAVGGVSSAAPGGLTLFADFDEIGGLKTRAPVVIAGVKVGQVRSIALGDDYRARVTLDLDPTLKLPDRHLGVDRHRRAARRPLHLAPARRRPASCSRPATRSRFTESAVLLERLIGKLVHNVGGAGKDSQ